MNSEIEEQIKKVEYCKRIQQEFWENKKYDEADEALDILRDEESYLKSLQDKLNTLIKIEPTQPVHISNTLNSQVVLFVNSLIFNNKEQILATDLNRYFDEFKKQVKKSLVSKKIMGTRYYKLKGNL